MVETGREDNSCKSGHNQKRVELQKIIICMIGLNLIEGRICKRVSKT